MSDGDQRAGRLIHRFHLIMDAIVDLPEDDIESVEELVQAGEWTVALENLCTQLYEYDANVPEETLAMIEELGRDVGVPDRYWKMLASDGQRSP
jgi:hypothetical protein